MPCGCRSVSVRGFQRARLEQRVAETFGWDVHAHCRRPAARSSSQSTTRPGSGSSAPLVAFGRFGVGEGEVDGSGTRSRRSTLRALEVGDDGGREGDDGAGCSAGRAGSAGGTDPASAFGFLGSGSTTVVAGFVSCGGGAGRAGSASGRDPASAFGLVGSGCRTVVAGCASCRDGTVSECSAGLDTIQLSASNSDAITAPKATIETRCRR